MPDSSVILPDHAPDLSKPGERSESLGLREQSLLSRPAILRAMETGGIVISKFRESQLKTGSYDIRLGQYYYRPLGKRDQKYPIFNPYDEEMVKDYYGELHVADFASNHKQYEEGSGQWKNIRPEHRIIILEPGEIILGHTLEFIGGTKDPTTGRCYLAEMKARSSVGRVGVEVCRCAGWGDIGYINRWTMEIVNTGPYPVILVVGQLRLAQMKFYELEAVEDKDIYGNDVSRDHYQSGVDIVAIQKAWRPHMLLPRLSIDDVDLSDDEPFQLSA